MINEKWFYIIDIIIIYASNTKKSGAKKIPLSF